MITKANQSNIKYSASYITKMADYEIKSIRRKPNCGYYFSLQRTNK